MGRPSKPLIKREEVVSASLSIIDTEGLDAFSMPKLARQLGVRAPSLYHHFADKSEILAAVAHHIAGVSVTRPRRRPGDDWPEYFVDLALNFRQAVLRHRNAAPVLMEHLPREVLINGYEHAAEFLTNSGVPLRFHVKILDGMETLSVGAVLTEAARGPQRRTVAFPNTDAQSHPHLAHALAANEFTVKELFAERVRDFLYGVMRDAPLERDCASMA